MLQIFRPLPVDSLRLAVFDLDGTLIDSRQDLCNSVNATLDHCGMKELPDDTIASFIGDGAGMLIRRALGVPGELESGVPSEELFDRAFQFFLSYYRAHKLDYTQVYPGVFESLDGLRTLPDGSPRAMAVLTNKPVGPALAICEALGLSPYFFRIYGGDSFPSKKPDPLGLKTLIDEAGVTPAETVMVGDSDVDVRTARNSGAWIVGCGFGLSADTLAGTDMDALVDHATEWATILNHAENAASQAQVPIQA
jgi:phosphoglycolate phosphatase